MNSIRAKAINVSKFVDPETKNNVDLAEWAKQAYAKKWGYVYGTYGEVLTESILTTKIAEAMKLNLPTDEIEETDEPTEPDREPTAEEAESPDPPPPPMDEYERTVADADKGNKWSQYRAAKFMLDRDGDHYDPKKAVEYLTGSAKQGYTVAKYMLGKLYLKGEDVPKQMLHALHWLESAVKDDNQYAEYLLGKTFLKGEDTADAHGRQAAKRKLYGDASTALNTPRNTVITHPP